MSEIIALVGNPNTGKTTLFNTLAKADEHVGNWHGVTVDYKEKKLSFSGKDFVLTDLPGAYSLSSYSFEEAVTRDYLLKNKDAKIINICDANNLERNLLLTLELIEMGFCPTICINMANDLKKTGKKIDIQKLETILGQKVFLIDAQNKKQAKTVLEFVANDTKYQKTDLQYVATFIKQFDDLFKDSVNLKNIENAQKIKLLEQDEFVLNQVVKPQDSTKVNDILSQNKTLEKVLSKKYDFIEKIIKQCVSFSSAKSEQVYGYSKLDKIVLNNFFSIPIFLLVVGLIFFLTFGKVGSFFGDKFSAVFEKFVFLPLSNFVKEKTTNLFVQNFICEAVFGSLLSLISFLPQIILMFLGLYVLEDSGYMSRLAFSLEDYFKKIGLSGKSVFTLLMGFGCGTTASLTSRNLEDKNSKIKTAILTPYISCSAKLPLYAVVCGAFFPKHRFLVVISLYLLGVLVSLGVSYFLNKTVLPSGKQSFIMELPKYRVPSAKKIFKNTIINIKQFLLRVGSVLLCFSCIVWLLQNINFKFQYAQGESILTAISKFIAPIFRPLGFGNYGAVACILCGFVAKEIIVSTIGIINGCGANSTMKDISGSLLVSGSAFYLTKASSVSFLVFALLYLPCISTVSVFLKEIGTKWTIFACVLELLISYALSFAIYRIALYFIFNGALAGMLSVVAFLGIVTAVLLVMKLIKKKNCCKFCKNFGHCKK